MSVRFTLLALAISGSFLAAAPIPREPKKSILSVFGELYDPGNDLKLEYDGNQLVVQMSDTMDASAAAFNGPRIGRPIVGDFEAVVAVKYSSSRDPLGDKVGGHLGGGLVAWESDSGYVFVNRHHWPSPGAQNGSNWQGGFDVHGAGGSILSHGDTCPEVPLDRATLIRLRRTGDTFTTDESRDNGKTWKRLTESKHTLGQELRVGLAVYNTTSGKGTVTFSDYSLKQGK